ncbi:DUF4468 domain-containing protein [Flavobacterium gilvum]|uniref:DUF4468 domain-containing protein n=1 Tax=Flavobacterium gilvum TaxID=1492737 RepID=A0AAC9N7A4_9FLAO|nr:DUF4468 domain-containing protein [Flavobacterium gilvum]AOW10093.1 hypothetical protein EM308_11590 [Flavobacterium gilvum]
MKRILISTLLIFSFCVYGQRLNVLPKDENGKVHFTKTIESNNLSQEQAYNKSKSFFSNNFNSAKDVIELDDKEKSTIIGKAHTILNIQNGKITTPVPLSFSIKIESKNNKCNVDIYNLIYNNGTFAETFFSEYNEARYIKANVKNKLIMESYRDQTLEKIAFIESKIKEELNKN